MMNNSIKNITREDILTTVKYNATFGELESIFDLVKIIEDETIESNDPVWQKMCIALYTYKLGVMQGKRDERSTKRKSIEPVKKLKKDKVEEIEDISKILKDSDVKTEDIRKIKHLVLGWLSVANKKY